MLLTPTTLLTVTMIQAIRLLDGMSGMQVKEKGTVKKVRADA